MNEIKLNKNIFGDAVIKDANYAGTYGPSEFSFEGLSDEAIAQAILHPIGTLPLVQLASGKKNVLIVTDDNTRQTPLQRILPVVLSELNKGGIQAENVTILIGLGTHRHMTQDEIAAKFGVEISSKYKIANHAWESAEELTSYGKCELGFEVVLNKKVKEADLLISVGSIVPHATAGFSGGGKTIMPGIAGEKTIEDTHWVALDYPMAEILGVADNKIRQAIISICRQVRLSFIINTVLFNGNKVYGIVAGELEAAHAKGIEISKEVYGVNIAEKTEIVVAEGYPTDLDLRQAIKAICSADIVCKDNGVIILVADCPEGAAPQFPAFSKYGFADPEKLFHDVETGKFKQKLMAYTLVAIGRIISKRVKAILVSGNFSEQEAQQLGFLYASNLQNAIDMALKITDKNAKIMVLKQAGEILPICHA